MNEKQKAQVERYLSVMESLYSGKLIGADQMHPKFHELFQWRGEFMIKDSILKEYIDLMRKFDSIDAFENLRNICIKNLVNGNFRANSTSAASNLISMYQAEVEGYMVEKLEDLIFNLKEDEK